MNTIVPGESPTLALPVMVLAPIVLGWPWFPPLSL
jgi:hypothetical protein